jgi:Kef-type K+ transport system membrane component KefB
MGGITMELLNVFFVFEDIHSNLFLDIALLLTVGIIGGKLAEMAHLPKATGYIIIGMLFGPNLFNLFNKDIIADFKTLKILGLGFIGYNIGLEVNMKMLKNNGKEVLFVTVFQSIATFVLVGGAILLLVDEYAWTYALMFGAIASVTTPAPIVACMRSYHTKGRLTQLLCPMIALDDVIGVVLFAFVLPISVYLAGHTGQEMTFNVLIGEPLLMITISLVVGLVIGLVLARLLKYFYKGDAITIFLIITVGLLFGIGFSYMFDTSSILLPLMIGAVLTNRLSFDLRDKVRMISDNFILPILLVFFTLSGAEIDIGLLRTLEILGVTYLVVRVVAKVGSAALSTTMMGEEPKVRKYLGPALIPQGGVAIDMAILAEIRFAQLASETGDEAFAFIGSTVLTVILGAVVIYKIIGEIVVKWAFRQANEITYEDHTPHSHLV